MKFQRRLFSERIPFPPPPLPVAIRPFRSSFFSARLRGFIVIDFLNNRGPVKRANFRVNRGAESRTKIEIRDTLLIEIGKISSAKNHVRRCTCRCVSEIERLRAIDDRLDARVLAFNPLRDEATDFFEIA